MQGQTNWKDSFPEAFDANQESSDSSVDRLATLSNRLSQVEGRLPNHRLAIHDGSISCTSNTNNRARDNRGWYCGESSSSGNNVCEKTLDDDSEMKLTWHSSYGASSGIHIESGNQSPEPSTTINSSYAGNQVTDISKNAQNYSTSPLNFRSNHRLLRDNNYHSGLEAGRSHTLHEPGCAGTEETQVRHASSSNLGISLCSYNESIEYNDERGPLFGSWGSSCKRKALEGSSRHFCSGGSSNSNQPMENTVQHPVPAHCTTSRNLSISSNFSSAGHLEQLNSRSGVGTSRVRSGRFTSSSVQEITENPVRNFATRSSHGHRESVPCDMQRGPSVGHSNLYMSRPQSHPISNSSNSLELMSPTTLPLNLNDTLNGPFDDVNEAGRAHMNPWDGSFSLRRGDSSSSFLLSGERSSGAHEVNYRSSLTNIPEYPTSVPSDTRDIYGNQIDWSFTPGTSLSSRNYSDLSIRPSSSWWSSRAGRLPHRNLTSQDQRRFSGTGHSIPFSHIESDSGSQISPFSLSHLASSSSDERTTSSHANHHSDRMPAAFGRDVRGDDTNGRNILAAVEGRHRLIRQVLTVMLRGAQLQDENYMLIDPFINGVAEFPNQDIDMMLDVDNMSYEELLVLEEQIGNVSTGLNEEKIRESMKNRKYEAVKVSQEIEPCCICREDYVGGDDIGILDCRHEFHTSCIKQWLILKNICPICRNTALET